jgi:hypothetical protein
MGVVLVDDHRHPRHRSAADAGGGDDHLCRAQDLGRDRASPRAERGWAVGLLQSFADGLKVFLKETIIPTSANKGLFLIAPIVTFTVALIVWAVVPFQPAWCSPTSMSGCSTSSRRARSAFTA